MGDPGDGGPKPYLLCHYASLVTTATIKQHDYVSNKISVYLTKYNSQSRMLHALHSWWLNESRLLRSNQEMWSLLAVSQDLVQVYQAEDTMLQSHWWFDLVPVNNALTNAQVTSASTSYREIRGVELEFSRVRVLARSRSLPFEGDSDSGCYLSHLDFG